MGRTVFSIPLFSTLFVGSFDTLGLVTQSRLFGSFYRVGFYGAAFGERLDGREFVYKWPKITRYVTHSN